MSSFEIIRAPILPMGLVNAHLIIGRTGAILVDSGLPGTEHRLLRVLRKHGLGFEDIKLIVITHAHVDHAGNALRIRELSKAPIVAHKGDLPYYLRERPMSFCSSGWFGRLFLKTGLMHEPYAAFTPDILMSENDELSLNDFGVDGVIRHAPGHTEGSLTIELSDRQALVGDLVASGLLLGGIALTNRPKSPPFEDDPYRVGLELQRLINNGNRQFYMGHGGPLTNAEIERHIASLMRR